jgi:uncharacterized protein
LTDEKVSRYIVISRNTYGDGDDLRARVVYATRTAQTLYVPVPVADALAAGDVSALSPGMRQKLRDAQVVVPAEEDETAAILRRNRAAGQDASLVQFILMPTSYCNMGCLYCGQEHERGGMNRNHRDKIRARVLRAIRRPGTKKVRIDWFGAEPMMGYPVIRDLAKDFTAAADEAGVEYSSEMVTNGSLLTATNLDVLINECRVTKFDITFDGPPEVHDVHRPLKAGGRSFWKIVNTVRAALDHPGYEHVGWEFRTNVDVHNQDHVSAYFDQMAELGFARQNVTFSIARVRPWSNDVSELELQHPDFADAEIGWMAQMQRLGLTFSRMPNVAKKVTCPAVRENSELISGKGGVFSCTDQPLVPHLEAKTALGHVSDDDLPDKRPAGLYDDWNDFVEAGKSGCRSCVFLPTCGGQCPKLWKEGYVPCPSYKFNAQGRLDLAAARLGLAVV